MIETIRISGVATYCELGATVSELQTVNFFYGSNGTGKTTISRVIGNSDQYSNCSLQWKSNQRLETVVYNRDFVEDNFSATAPLKGIFTLGEDTVEIHKQLEALHDQERKYALKLVNDEHNLNVKKQELNSLNLEIEEACWRLKAKYDDRFGEAFAGNKSSKAKFALKLDQVRLGPHTGPPASTQSLEKRAALLLGIRKAEQRPLLAPRSFDHLRSLQENELMGLSVVGAAQVGLAELIERLSASDWVRQGGKFLDLTGDVCPFCQQPTPSSLQDELGSYFDETYQKRLCELEDFSKLYQAEINSVESWVAEVTRCLSQDAEEAEGWSKLADQLLTILKKSKKLIEQKLRQPSLPLGLEPCDIVLDSLLSRFESLNSHIRDQNKLIAERKLSRTSLVEDIWYYIAREPSIPWTEYDRRRRPLTGAITGLKKQIEKLKSARSQVDIEIKKLERKITSVRPTIEGINSILQRFGFSGFRLDESQEHVGFYALRRSDGTDAARTLSEGERSFLTFLYFYHLLRGSHSGSGTGQQRIVVIDDPVSSLDSDVLFIVSTLIKKLIEDARSGSNIKQIFVLTHNPYFHKEVSFHRKRKNGSLHDESFYTIRKVQSRTLVQRHVENPVRTSYELLWRELREDRRDNLSLQNNMRRILEYYFKILGGIEFDTICEQFEAGPDEMICRSLFSWVNDGSHFPQDSLFIEVEDSTVDRYLVIFEKIFELTHHRGHYDMMMGNPVRVAADALSPGAPSPGVEGASQPNLSGNALGDRISANHSELVHLE